MEGKKLLTKKEKYLTIIEHYGVHNQLKKINEELFEFCEAVYEADFTLENVGHVEEELADIFVLLEQFRAYYDLNLEKVSEIMKCKVERQLKRIQKESFMKKFFKEKFSRIKV